MKSSTEFRLTLPQPPVATYKGNILPVLENITLIFIGKTCDARLHEMFNNIPLSKIQNGNVILTGTWDKKKDY